MPHHPSHDQTNQPGRKRRFGLAGIANVIAANLLLQIMMASNAFSIGTSTLLSQVFNGIIGYTLYGKLVFRTESLRHARSIARYGGLMAILWLGNWIGISGLETLGVSRSPAAIAMVLPLAALSYSMQKIWVFSAQ